MVAWGLRLAVGAALLLGACTPPGFGGSGSTSGGSPPGGATPGSSTPGGATPGSSGTSAGSGGTAPQSSSPQSSTPPNRYSAAETAAAAVGTWRGTYSCPQGRTGLDIVLERDSGDRLRGTFRFYPVAGNPNVPRGCFNIGATASQGGRIRTNAGAWVTRPPGYESGDIEGVLNTDGTWSGNILAVGQCGGFLLRRVTKRRRLAEPRHPPRRGRIRGQRPIRAYRGVNLSSEPPLQACPVSGAPWQAYFLPRCLR